jgi:hypothetical protein
MKRERKWGTFPVESTVGGAFENGKNDVRELAEEMGSWRDNMQGTALENTGKYSEVEEAADALESAADALDNVEIPGEVASVTVTVSILRKKHLGRASRMGNATAWLDGAVQGLRETIEELEETRAKTEEDGTEYSGLDPDELGCIADEIDDAKDEADGVEFPGMF